MTVGREFWPFLLPLRNPFLASALYLSYQTVVAVVGADHEVPPRGLIEAPHPGDDHPMRPDMEADGLQDRDSLRE